MNKFVYLIGSNPTVADKDELNDIYVCHVLFNNTKTKEASSGCLTINGKVAVLFFRFEAENMELAVPKITTMLPSISKDEQFKAMSEQSSELIVIVIGEVE